MKTSCLEQGRRQGLTPEAVLPSQHVCGGTRTLRHIYDGTHSCTACIYAHINNNKVKDSRLRVSAKSEFPLAAPSPASSSLGDRAQESTCQGVVPMPF